MTHDELCGVQVSHNRLTTLIGVKEAGGESVL